jgi:hypothetical protein
MMLSRPERDVLGGRGLSPAPRAQPSPQRDTRPETGCPSLQGAGLRGNEGEGSGSGPALVRVIPGQNGGLVRQIHAREGIAQRPHGFHTACFITQAQTTVTGTHSRFRYAQVYRMRARTLKLTTPPHFSSVGGGTAAGQGGGLARRYAG